MKFSRVSLFAGTSFTVLAVLGAPAYAQAVSCGGDFSSFKAQMADQARAAGIGESGTSAILNARQDGEVLKRDRSQGVFTLDFVTFARRLISNDRMQRGTANLIKYKSVFDRARSEYGIAPEIITAFWAFETDYGAVQGDFRTVDALTTLAHDCRRPELFQPQLMALAELIDKNIVPSDVTGAWAGEIGQIQVLPDDYLRKGRDGDGDGRIEMKTSAPDAILTAANFLASLGWQANQPWLQEVNVPASMEWFDAGLHQSLPVSEWAARGVTARSGSLPANLSASLLLPVGKDGPAFLAYPNFNVLLNWNQSLTYVTTAAYFATRLSGAPVFGNAENVVSLSADEVKQLQSKLTARGYDVGEIDGVIGAGTRNAVRLEQKRLGLPADAWPDRQLLNAL